MKFNFTMDLSRTKIEMLGFIVGLTFLSAVAFYGSRYLMRRFDPLFQSRKKALEIAEKQLRRVAKNIEKPLSIDSLTQYELMMASNLVHPDDITITWRNIAGLEEVIQELKETIILPIRHKRLLAGSNLSSPPKGVLLHGPPGCGKTLIAKATAKEAGMNFINLDVSTLTDKWYGESQKLAAAVFSLGVKLQPCIIFIDEIDSFLRNRSVGDHEATAMMKAQFMSWWDGLITDDNCSVIVMGATNRPRDLDSAIFRRMPVRLNIGLPRQAQREQILELVLRHEPIDSEVDCHKLAVITEGFSGSDLKEMCRVAALFRMRDFLDSPVAQGDGDSLRLILMSDLENAVEKMRASKVLCNSIPMPTSSLDVE